MIEMIAQWTLWTRGSARLNRILSECTQMSLEKWSIEECWILCRHEWFATSKKSFRN